MLVQRNEDSNKRTPNVKITASSIQFDKSLFYDYS
jgi:hypothetical protein